MNLNKIKEILFNFIEEYVLKLVRQEEVEDAIRITAKFSLLKNSDDVIMYITILTSGALIIDFNINKINKTFVTLDVLNQLNNGLTWLKARLSDDDQLVLSYNAIDVSSEKNIYLILDLLYGEFVDDYCLSKISKLMESSYKIIPSSKIA